MLWPRRSQESRGASRPPNLKKRMTVSPGRGKKRSRQRKSLKGKRRGLLRMRAARKPKRSRARWPAAMVNPALIRVAPAFTSQVASAIILWLSTIRPWPCGGRSLPLRGLYSLRPYRKRLHPLSCGGGPGTSNAAAWRCDAGGRRTRLLPLCASGTEGGAGLRASNSPLIRSNSPSTPARTQSRIVASMICCQSVFFFISSFPHRVRCTWGRRGTAHRAGP